MREIETVFEWSFISESRKLFLLCCSLSVLLVGCTDWDAELWNSVKEGNADQMVQCIRKGADVNGRNKFGYAPLHCAAMFNQPKSVEALIKYGASIDPVSEDDEIKTTPLFIAAGKGSSDVAEMLLNAGANPNFGQTVSALKILPAIAQKGEYLLDTPLTIAIKARSAAENRTSIENRGRFLSIIKALIEHGASLNTNLAGEVPTVCYLSPMHWAIFTSDLEVIELLAKHGAELNRPLPEMLPPLEWAVSQKNDHLETVKLLIKLGANPRLCRPLEGARIAGNTHILSYLTRVYGGENLR